VLNASQHQVMTSLAEALSKRPGWAEFAMRRDFSIDDDRQ